MWYRDISGTGDWNNDTAYAAAATWFGGTWITAPVAGNWPQPAAQALQAATPASAAQSSTTSLTSSQLQPLVQAAIERWAAAGATAQMLATMETTPIAIANLPGSELGQLSGNTITIDQNAAGWGWFVDSTPNQDQEFAAQPGTTQLQAVDPQASGHMDLLTVVEHELGHRVGLSDLDASATSVMSGQLPTDVRRDVTTADVDAVFASAATHDWL
jgi:hypothetical protein